MTVPSSQNFLGALNRCQLFVWLTNTHLYGVHKWGNSTLVLQSVEILDSYKRQNKRRHRGLWILVRTVFLSTDLLSLRLYKVLVEDNTSPGNGGSRLTTLSISTLLFRVPW